MPQSKFIAFANRKGGVAKTTTLTLFATALRERTGQKVLIVDADSQLSIKKYEEREAAICDIIAFDWSLPNVKERLIQLAEDAEENYQYVFWDLQGAMEGRNIYLVLNLCDVILVPFTPSQLVYDATITFLKALPQVTENRAKQGFKTSIIAFLTMNNRTLEAKDIKEAISSQGVKVLDSSLSDRVRYRRGLTLSRQIVSSTNGEDEFNIFYNELLTELK